jgi:hypothetical protein
MEDDSCNPPADDAESGEDHRPSWIDDWRPLAKHGAMALAAAAVVLVLWTSAQWLWAAAGPRDLRVSVQGCGVPMLSNGARVVLGTRQIGEVERVDDDHGEKLARLRIDHRHAEQLPANAEFEVDSLNEWLPGNVGIRVRSRAGSEGPRLAEGAGVTAVDRILPPVVPWKFYPLVGACLLAVMVLYRLAVRLEKILVFLIGVAVIVAGLMYLNGVVSPP